MKNNNLHAFLATTGTRIIADEVTAGAKGCTLANSKTYYFPLPSDIIGGRDMDVEVKWAAAVAAVFTIETTSVPQTDLSDYDATAGTGWQQANPPNAYVPVAGTGNSASAATVTAGGTNAGTATFSLTEVTAPRLRIKAVVTTGGVVRVTTFGKGKL